MAVQKRKKGKQSFSRAALVGVVFWLVFIIVIVSIFVVNLETIQKNFNLFKARITGIDLPSENVSTETSAEDDPAETVVQILSPANTHPTPETTAQPAQTSSTIQTDTQTEPAQPLTPTETTPAATVQTRDRNIYFTRITNDGQILHTRVTRRIPVSESPMVDTLNVMLMGPSAEEINSGLLNLIPQNTRIVSAIVRGSTAYISFSEDFLFNTFGVEGYIAQLRQIVWTVTEFSNVRDVQILIEGQRLDYLGEGIWIGSPISRESF